ncbi:MAG: EAL domain-containing protein [Sideroxydans sp.]
MSITWNISLVVLSVLIAIIGSYTALLHAQRMRESSGRTATIWMLAGASTLGLAIWSMHFVGMLAFQLPVAIGYDLHLTVFSLLPSVVAALLGFRVLRDPIVSSRRIFISGLLMGMGISAMHYLGMAALKMSPSIFYDPWLFALSVLIAIAASWGALLIMYREDWLHVSALPRTVLGALMMGTAISAMHYTAMLGLHIPEGSMCLVTVLRIEPKLLAMMIASLSLVWFGGGLMANLFDQRMARKNAYELSVLGREYQSLMERSNQVSASMITALRESEERLLMTLQNAPDAVFITEKDGRISYVNDNVVTLLGYERIELYRMSVFDLVPPDWRDTYRRVGQQIVQGPRQVLDIRLVSKTGQKIPLELNAVLLPNGRVYGACRDIRERKKIEASLKASLAFTETLVQALPLPIFYKNAEGRYTGCNKQFCDFLGKDKIDIVGKTVFEISPQKLAADYRDKDLDLLQEGVDEQVYESNVKRGDGELRDVIFHKAKLTDGSGKTVGIIGAIWDMTERKAMENKMHDLAFYDPLTRLPNRRLLLERTQQALTVSTRNGRYGALMLLDLDDFKKLNDSQGHDVGDLLLCEVAKRLQTVIREGDTVARLGGDEFVVVLESLSTVDEEAAKQAEVVAEKIRIGLSKPYDLGAVPHQTSSSIGVALFRGHLESKDALLKHADIAMYQAKHAGRNAIRFYDKAMQAAIELRATLETDLQVALKHQQFQLFYQVQVNAVGKPIGAEVLLRWQHPLKGLILPNDFISLAEENGLIVPIGLWVLNAACAQIQAWSGRADLGQLSLAVNVCAKQFHQADFVAQVMRAVTEHGINPMLLKLELTESMVLNNIEESIAKMQALKEFGVNFALDDFGTGYSSLSHLKQLPLTQIKIDQSFVRNLSTDSGDKVMVMTIVDLCMNFELDVMAEGVETEAQFKLLHRYGCGNFQGYLFGRPVPLEQFEQWLLQR